MRTTVTLDSDTEALVRRRMRERRVSFKVALNDLIRGAGRSTATVPFRTKTHSMGRPSIDLDKALTLAGELEDDELVRRTGAGS